MHFYVIFRIDLSVNMNGKEKVSKSFFLPCEELGQIMLEVCKFVTSHLRLVYM